MKTILFSGASGFLGKNVYPLLAQDYNIERLGLSTEDTHCIDFSKEIPILKKQYDIVLHAAGKAHLNPTSKEEIDLFYLVNLNGAKNLCTAFERSFIPNAIIFISTVAVYGIESGIDITENHPLNGTSPYALSKMQAETYLAEWCGKHNVILGILRPSLIAGKNPPGNLGAMIKGIKTGKYLSIGKGEARKSILMAEDIARIIPKLAEIGGTYNLCDDHHPSFRELEGLIAGQLNKKSPTAIPYWMAKSLALAGDIIGNIFPINSGKLDKITKPLTFSNEKAKRELNWKPMDVLENFKIS